MKVCTGFLYRVSIVGITGERDQLPDTLQQQLQRLRTMTDLPLLWDSASASRADSATQRDRWSGVIVGRRNGTGDWSKRIRRACVK